MPFDSAIAVFAVCAHCRSSLVRRDAQVELMGQQAQLPPDISPLRVGTRGSFDGRPFAVIGRVRVGYPEGSWNEWCVDFGDGSWGWIAEAQGTYAVSFEIAAPADIPGAESYHKGSEGLTLKNHGLAAGREAMPIGRHVVIDGVAYTVRDRKQTNILGSEGTLPFVATPGRAAVSADLAGPGRAFANAEYSEEGIRVFVGRLCTFDELLFEDLRPLPGWTADAERIDGNSDALNCVSCGAAMRLRAPGLTMTAVCANCGAILDTGNLSVQVVDIAARRQAQIVPVIPIGRRGKLGDVEYECIGMMRRRDGDSCVWHEYLLFNPFAGFRWLVTYQGNWTFVEVLLEQPADAIDERVWNGRPYRRFSSGYALVTYVIGEFYWQVRLRERTEIEDFVAPPNILSSEHYPDLAETTWSLGTDIDRALVGSAFGVDLGRGRADAAGAAVPNPHADAGATLRWLAPLLAGTFLVIALAGAATRDHELVHEWNFTPSQAGTNGSISTEPFVIGGTHAQSLEIEMNSGVSNGWIEAGIDLVNLDTQAVREASVESSHYSGYDDGPWSEDNRQRSIVLSGVPPGRYRLVVESQTEPVNPDVSFGLKLTRDVMVWSNFWIGFVALWAYPVFKWLREHAFERERWSASDSSPFTSVSEMFSSDDD